MEKSQKHFYQKIRLCTAASIGLNQRKFYFEVASLLDKNWGSLAAWNLSPLTLTTKYIFKTCVNFLSLTIFLIWQLFKRVQASFLRELPWEHNKVRSLRLAELTKSTKMRSRWFPTVVSSRYRHFRTSAALPPHIMANRTESTQNKQMYLKFAHVQKYMKFMWLFYY